MCEWKFQLGILFLKSLCTFSPASSLAPRPLLLEQRCSYARASTASDTVQSDDSDASNSRLRSSSCVAASVRCSCSSPASSDRPSRPRQGLHVGHHTGRIEARSDLHGCHCQPGRGQAASVCGAADRLGRPDPARGAELGDCSDGRLQPQTSRRRRTALPRVRGRFPLGVP